MWALLYQVLQPSLRQNCASASTGWVTGQGKTNVFSYPAPTLMQVYCQVSKNGLGHRPLAWQPQKNKLTTQSFWLLSSSGHGHPSVSTCTLFFCRGRTAYSCRFQAGHMAEADFCVRGLAGVLPKAINPSVREYFLRFKVWKSCTSIPLVFQLL